MSIRKSICLWRTYVRLAVYDCALCGRGRRQWQTRIFRGVNIRLPMLLREFISIYEGNELREYSPVANSVAEAGGDG